LERPRFSPTGRVLAGRNRWEPSRLPTGAYGVQSGFAFGFGQSIDLKLSELIAFRVQPDLYFARRKPATGESKSILVNPISFESLRIRKAVINLELVLTCLLPASIRSAAGLIVVVAGARKK
jgi:hypothetical protein